MVLNTIERFQYAGLREVGLGLFHIKLWNERKKENTSLTQIIHKRIKYVCLTKIGCARKRKRSRALGHNTVWQSAFGATQKTEQIAALNARYQSTQTC